MAIPPLSIGNLTLDSNVLMAPMCGLSTRPYRILALRHGCALSAAEMLAAEHLVRAGPAQRREYVCCPEEKPSSMQIVGSRPEVMADAAALLEDLGADVVDLNMGCPARRILRGGGGAALMNDLALASRMVAGMVQRVQIPVTVKIRAGWDDGHLNAAEVARAVEQAGAAAITVHARTKEARHRGGVRLDVISAVKSAVRIPVIGNGGLRSPADAEAMLRKTGCDGVMYGRAAIGDVWLFSRTSAYLREGVEPPPPAMSERLEVMAEHLRLLAAELGEEKGVLVFRKCIPHYLKGVRGVREARHELLTLRKVDEVVSRAREVLLSGDPPAAAPASPPPQACPPGS